MKNKNGVAKENIHAITKTFPLPAKKCHLDLRKVGTVPFLNRCITRNSPDPRRSTLSSLQCCSFIDARHNHFEQRFFTQALPLECSGGKKRKVDRKDKGHQIQEGVRVKKERSRKQRSRKSRSSSLGCRSCSGARMASGEQELDRIRLQIKEKVKKIGSKKVVKRKEFLKITDNYESLLDKMASLLSEKPGQAETPLPEAGGGGKMMLKLSGLKGLGIPDYADEFMSHYEELSESWKRDLHFQKRF